jgi:hypothetical protein
VRERGPALAARALVVGAAGALQASQVWAARVGSNDSRLDLLNVLEIVGRRLFAPLVLGPFVGMEVPGLPFGLAALALAAFLLWALPGVPRRPAVVARSPDGNKAVYLVTGAVLITTAALYISRAAPETLYNLYSQDRFFYPPLVLILWSLVQTLGARTWALRVPAALLLAITAVRTLGQPSYPIFVTQNLRWEQASRCIGEQEPCRIAINPPGWFLDYRPEGSRSGPTSRNVGPAALSR